MIKDGSYQLRDLDYTSGSAPNQRAESVHANIKQYSKIC